MSSFSRGLLRAFGIWREDTRWCWAKALEPYDLFWMEDPVMAELQEGFSLIRQHTTIPIAMGEVFNSFHDAHDLIRHQWIDYPRSTERLYVVGGDENEGGVTGRGKARRG